MLTNVNSMFPFWMLIPVAFIIIVVVVSVSNSINNTSSIPIQTYKPVDKTKTSGKFCVSCGKENFVKASFCISCGAKIPQF